MSPTKERFTAIGLMSGTSADGVDGALLETDGVEVFRTGASTMLPYADTLRDRLFAVMRDPALAETGEFAELERDLAAANAAVVTDVLTREGIAAEAVDVIGFHGQTVLHRPERRLTRQLGDGAWLSKLAGIPVVNRFRDADVAAGGQGAPLVPVYHAALARQLAGPLAILNLGGVANVTLIDGERLLAFDTGPASALLDDWVRRHTGAAYDDGGRIAAAGRIDESRLVGLLADLYFDRAPPKSLDRNDFPLAAMDGLSLEDGAATLLAFTARSVAKARAHLGVVPKRWLVTGGGRHNTALMAALAEALDGVEVSPVETVNWVGDTLEAQAFAFLAVRSLKGLPLSLPGTTGVPYPMPGGLLHQPAP
ncbi:MAG TPA: anhydro-N-acetylmuramic acid kinase [Stellaceae bacterium]|nr:anhydro-N-acetylmuramic acid kinase [Stellaceae bacterium]